MIIRNVLNAVTTEEQAQAARFNNRSFLFRMITDYVSPHPESPGKAKARVLEEAKLEREREQEL